MSGSLPTDLLQHAGCQVPRPRWHGVVIRVVGIFEVRPGHHTRRRVARDDVQVDVTILVL
jgi:hypothetical protein